MGQTKFKVITLRREFLTVLPTVDFAFNVFHQQRPSRFAWSGGLDFQSHTTFCKLPQRPLIMCLASVANEPRVKATRK